MLGGTEALDDLQALQGLVLTLLRAVGAGAVTELVGERVEVEAQEHIVNSLGTGLTDELVGIAVLELVVAGVFGIQVVEVLLVLIFAEDGVGILLQGLGSGLTRQLVVDACSQHPRLDEDVALVVDDGLELLGRHTQEVCHLVGQRTEVPYVGYGHLELDVPHALTAYLLLRDLDTAAVTDDATIADALVLTAVALEVPDGTEDTLTEEAVTLGLVGTVVDGLRLEHLTAGVLQDLLWGGQRYPNL